MEGGGTGDIESLLAQGEFLAAYDATTTALAATAGHPPLEVLRLRYLGALALARSGATTRASDAVAHLAADLDDAVPDELAEDVAALGARVAKDRALRTEPGARQPLLADAAARYEAVHRRLGRPFAAINAATLWFLAADVARAEELARRAVAVLPPEASSPLDRYWAAATRAEAALVLGAVADARAALADAGRCCPDDYAARASTRRQLRLLCEARALDADDVLAPLANPAVVHYCGHRIDAEGAPGRFPASQEGRVREEIDRWLSTRRVGFAHGSLAGGADVLAAEAALAAGAALHLVLPFDPEEFVAVSVRPCGRSWVDRFDACLHAATSVTVASDSAYLGDDVLFAYAARLAMGHAINRAEFLQSDAVQVAVWDGRPSSLPAGTAHDVGVWRRAGLPTHVVAVGSPDVGAAPVPAGPDRRSIHAVLFGDVAGFSRLRDQDIEAFLDTVMAPVARVLDRFGGNVLQRNTWGDGLFVVASDVVAGAEVALAVQRALAGVDLAGANLPPDLAMRIGAHAGPLVRVWDPVLDAPALMGRELTRAARIEPRTPPGEVYVTSAFAALLALEPAARAVPEYVGHLATAKGFETVPMYVLRPR